MSKSRSQSTIPAFLQKTYDILENPALQDIVGWNEDGTGFLVKNVIAFQDQVLPMYFKHRNFASFVRQMNMYGFHKSRSDLKENEFIHPYFKKDQKHLLKKIKRKSGEQHDEGYSIMELKPHRVQQHSQLSEMMSKHNELEKICKILIEQNNKILNYNQYLRNQLIQEKLKGQKKKEKIQQLYFDNQQDYRTKEILNILESDDDDNEEEDQIHKKLKQDESDSTIEKEEQQNQHQLMLTNEEPLLMITNEEQNIDFVDEEQNNDKLFLPEPELSHQYLVDDQDLIEDIHFD